jgi:hypothetical protein
MNYYDMSVSELKDLRAKKLVEYSEKRTYYCFCKQGIIKNKELNEGYDKTMEKIKDEMYTLNDFIWGLNDLIREKENE